MCHHVCLDSLTRSGASPESVTMVASFLTGRRMRMKIGSHFSSERAVKGGSLQGTRLGNFLFVVTIDNIEQGLDHIPPAIDPAEPEANEDIYGLRRLAGRIGAVRRFNSGVEHASTPWKLGTTDGVLRYLDCSGRENSTLTMIDPSLLACPPNWRDIPPWVLKFVDDVNVGERHFLRNAISTYSQEKERKRIKATSCEEIFSSITRVSENIGMKVNQSKTQLLCLTAAINSEVSSFITTPSGDTVESSSEMVLLGFKFGNKPTVAAHVDFIISKFNSRSWLIRHLKQAGVPDQDLVKKNCYCN